MRDTISISESLLCNDAESGTEESEIDGDYQTTIWSITMSASTGNLYGRVSDERGAALPGVTLTLNGLTILSEKGEISDAQGGFRFGDLSPSFYTLRAALEGFSATTHANIRIEPGRDMGIGVTMKPDLQGGE